MTTPKRERWSMKREKGKGKRKITKKKGNVQPRGCKRRYPLLRCTTGKTNPLFYLPNPKKTQNETVNLLSAKISLTEVFLGFLALQISPWPLPKKKPFLPLYILAAIFSLLSDSPDASPTFFHNSLISFQVMHSLEMLPCLSCGTGPPTRVALSSMS